MIYIEHERLFIFGENDFGQLGLGNQYKYEEIVHHEFFDGKNLLGFSNEDSWFSWELLTFQSKSKEYSKWKIMCPHINLHFE